MLRVLSLSFLLILILTTSAIAADQPLFKPQPEQNWGIGAALRSGSIAFGEENGTVTSFVPLLFYSGKHFYLEGLSGGLKLYQDKDWRFSLMGRLRFFDIPKDFQNLIQGDTADFGGQLRYRLSEQSFVDTEFLTDQHWNYHVNLRFGYQYQRGDFDWQPYVGVRFKSGQFNSRYYGLEWAGFERIQGGIDLQAGFRARYHLWRNLYLIGAANLTHLDRKARASEPVTTSWQGDAWLGVAFFNEHKKALKPRLRNSRYLRLAHGWATPSNLNAILSGDTVKDAFNNQLSSIFYGHPLTDELFGLPLDIYLHSGLVWHHSSEVQDSSQELVVAIKLYYTLPLPIRIRFGVAEGFSYINEVTYIERTEMERKGYETSNLLNYLDFSLDINVGDIVRSHCLRPLWLGYSIHHRSAIFESAQHFGRIKGGSNYNTVYLQWHF